jgi:hypothetical protein
MPQAEVCGDRRHAARSITVFTTYVQRCHVTEVKVQPTLLTGVQDSLSYVHMLCYSHIYTFRRLVTATLSRVSRLHSRLLADLSWLRFLRLTKTICERFSRHRIALH